MPVKRRYCISRLSGRTRFSLTMGFTAAALSLSFPGCSSGPTKRARPGATPVIRDLDPALRGLIGSMTTLDGREPMLVSGYGLVVGLNGTGSSDIPVNLRAYMEREMGVRGVGKITQGYGKVSPTQLLNDPNTAVVRVQAAIPPGAPVSTQFDVLITALPGSSTTSIEGGRLWTTELFRGDFVPGGPATSPVATAHGQIFINPFVNPADAGTDAFSRRSGRILFGGRVKKKLDLLLLLDNPSHARARSIVSTINAEFPQGPGDRQPVAQGRSEEVIVLNVPQRRRNDTNRFIQLLLHTRVDQSFPQEYALRYGRALRAQPDLAESLSWCMQSIGKLALPDLRRMYDYAELAPQLAALQAGAGLGDPLVAPHLIELASHGPSALRTRAIKLLGKLDPDPSVNQSLRKLLNVPELDVRIAAYEALQKRFDPSIQSIYIGDKFVLDVVDADETMIYVSQQGQPRIIVFGDHPELVRPTFVSAWNDRLMLTADSATDELRIYYQDFRRPKATTIKVSASLPEFIEFLAHKTTPEEPAPGLDLTYSEVVGALYEIWKEDGIPGVFVAEQDRLLVDLLRSMQGLFATDRPETTQDAEETVETARKRATSETTATVPTQTPEKRTFVVPLKKSGSPK